jgi:hypothetical protein
MANPTGRGGFRKGQSGNRGGPGVKPEPLVELVPDVSASASELSSDSNGARPACRSFGQKDSPGKDDPNPPGHNAGPPLNTPVDLPELVDDLSIPAFLRRH